MDALPLSSVEIALLAATYFRGGSPEEQIHRSSSDQIITLSLFYTGEISAAECVERFSIRSYVGELYEEDDEDDEDGYGKLNEMIAARYAVLIQLVRNHPKLIEGAGNLETPAHPTYTACRLTIAGQELARSLIPTLPQKPEFPNWPDKRAFPG